MPEICMAALTKDPYFRGITLHQQSISLKLIIQQWQRNILLTYMMEALVILWHKSLRFEPIQCTCTDAMAAATRQQSDAKIMHVFKNQNQGTL